MSNTKKSKVKEFISKFIDLDNTIIVKLREFFTLDLIIFILVLVAIRISVLGNYKVPTGSMIPTIEIGDKLFANKLAYSLKAPIPFININLLNWRKPKRGDIIAFRNPNNEKEMYTKRVIGLPEDKIEIIDTDLFINDKKIEKTFISKVVEYQYIKPGSEKNKSVLDKFVHNGFEDNENIKYNAETNVLTVTENYHAQFYFYMLALILGIYSIGFMKFTKSMLADKTKEQKRKLQIYIGIASLIVLIAGVIFQTNPITSTFETQAINTIEYDYYYEHLGNVKHFIRFNSAAHTEIKEDGDTMIENYTDNLEKGNYFVMGDNRDNSSDSRVWGQLIEDNIEGKLALRWLVFKPHTFVIDFKRLGLVK